MTGTKTEPPTLASRWSPTNPEGGPDSGPGQPVACIASTFTFDARFFETDLLPRFLGLKYDNTEGERPFLVERETALSQVRVCVLVDQSQFRPEQSTLRWDQIPVRVPGAIQHSKVTLLVWE